MPEPRDGFVREPHPPVLTPALPLFGWGTRSFSGLRRFESGFPLVAPADMLPQIHYCKTSVLLAGLMPVSHLLETKNPLSYFRDLSIVIKAVKFYHNSKAVFQVKCLAFCPRFWYIIADLTILSMSHIKLYFLEANKSLDFSLMTFYSWKKSTRQEYIYLSMLHSSNFCKWCIYTIAYEWYTVQAWGTGLKRVF